MPEPQGRRPIGSVLRGPCRMMYYTDLQEVLRAFGGREREFDWLITDLECNVDPGFLADLPRQLLPGDTLSDLILKQKPGVQFIWGVFSGIPQGAAVGVADLTVVPAAYGEAALWTRSPQIQLPGATVELICWDSSSTILITSDVDLTRRFRSHFPEARDMAPIQGLRQDIGES